MMIRILRLALRENLSRQKVLRRPEPDSLMQNHVSVGDFHNAGAADGGLLPVYHFNAWGMSHLLPPGGTLLDIGSGSGQYLMHLAKCRPDIRIIGLDLSKAMVSLGNRSIESAGLQQRVQLRSGDMTRFRKSIGESIDVVSSIFSLHHLNSAEQLGTCIKEIHALRRSNSCAVWIFDHVRPRHRRTVEEFPDIFTPGSSRTFKQDSRNSLEASFSFNELRRISEKFLGAVHHEQARVLPLYQIHWANRVKEAKGGGHHLWTEPQLPPDVERDHSRFCRLFPKVRSLFPLRSK
jgi:arsenite methyltransferase